MSCSGYRKSEDKRHRAGDRPPEISPPDETKLPARHVGGRDQHAACGCSLQPASLDEQPAAHFFCLVPAGAGQTAREYDF